MGLAGAPGKLDCGGMSINYFLKISRWSYQQRRHWSSVALLFGFMVDNLTLKRIDLPFETFVLLAYLCLAGLGILFLNVLERRPEPGKWSRRIYLFLPLMVQFAFGALFSAFFIFYSRSGSLDTSWPFLLFLVVLLIGNEFVKKRYLLTSFRLSIFYLVLFTFAIFYLPVVVGQMGAWIFVFSGLASLLGIGLLIGLLFVIDPDKIRQIRRVLIVSIGTIFIVMNFLYFTNIIPPIPLALKEIEIFHQIKRQAGGYQVLVESKPWYAWLRRPDQYHFTADSAVYAFSSVFAPTNLETPIIHEWQHWIEATKEWTTVSRIAFTIAGGRDQGYRGYSVKQNILPGRWRVNVKTPRGQLIGRKTFEVEVTAVAPDLLTAEI